MRGAVLAAVALLAAAAAPAVAAGDTAQPPAAQTSDHQGVRVALEVEPLGDGPVRVGESSRIRFRFTDAHTGQPYAGLYPGAWLDLLPAPGESPEAERDGTADTCREKIQAFVAGSLFHPPEIDLNVYYVLALNADGTITVVDPLFSFGNTQLLALVDLGARGADWVHAERHGRLFVSLPETSRVAVVETATWDVPISLDTGPRPGRLALQPDERRLWVAFDGAEEDAAGGGVTAIDAAHLRRLGDVATGRGPHDLAVSDDGRFLFVTNAGDGTVSVIDAPARRKLRDVAVGGRPLAIAWSSAAAAAYVTDAEGGRVVAVRADAAEPVARIELAPGLGRIRFAPGGRLGFVVHPPTDEVHLLDAATNRVVQTADVEDRPDDVAFSDELAYVRHRGSDAVLMIPLDVVGVEGRPVPVIDFPGGQHPPGAGPAVAAPGIVQAPGASAVLVANPLDEVIYYYKEGMAAPMGHFRNYGRQPLAVEVVDRSLREVAPGTYETTVELRRAGRYEVALWVDAPRLMHCFPLTVAEAPRRPPGPGERAVEVALASPHQQVRVGQEVRARFRVTGTADGAPRTGDAVGLAFLVPGNRRWDPPAAEVGTGVYELRFTPPEPGIYYVFLEIPSEGLPLQESPYLVVRAVAAETAAETRRGGLTAPATPAPRTPAAGRPR